MMFYVLAIGWLLLSLMFFPNKGFEEISHLTLNGWLATAFLGIFCSGFAYVFWYDSLSQVPASQVGVFLYIEPMVTVIVAALAIGETMTLAAGVGGGIILLGVWLVNRPTAKEQTELTAFATRKDTQ
jgi:drug/metabolite transporter (DMT)-like permease